MKTQILTLIIMAKTVFLAPGQVNSAQEPIFVKCLTGVPSADATLELHAFVQLVNAANAENAENCCDIFVANTAFVMKNGLLNTQGASIERFNHPFLTIQEAVTFIGPASANSFRTVIVYPGDYTENITLLDNTNIFFYPGANVTGNIALSNGCHLYFSDGCTVTGNIIDNGVSMISYISGRVVHIGSIICSGPSSIITVHGKQMRKAIFTAGSTFNCYFQWMEGSTAAQITGTNSTLNIYGLTVLQTGFISSPITQNVGTGSLNMYNCIVNSTGAGVFFGGTDGVMWNCRVKSSASALTCNGTGVFEAVNNYFESVSNEAVKVTAASTIKLILRRNYLNGSTDAILTDATAQLVLEANTLIATGDSVNSVSAATNIKSLVGNGSNQTVNANVTETISTIFVDANYE